MCAVISCMIMLADLWDKSALLIAQRKKAEGVLALIAANSFPL